MASGVYTKSIAESFGGSLDWDTGTFKLALVTSAYSPNLDTDTNWDDISTHEVAGAGYTAGGNTVTPSVAAGTGEVVVNLPGTTWSASTITARGAVYYKSSTTVKYALAYIDFNSDESTDGGSFIIGDNKFTINL